MSDVWAHLAFLRDPRLASHATSAAPVWLWSTDATRILWANPVGAAIFNAPTPAALAARRFEPGEQAAAQIARLAGTLPHSGAARLGRLRGFGTLFWRTLLCTCSRITLADHTAGILVVAMETAGRALSLAERVRRLYEGCDQAIAVFSPDGALLYATQNDRQQLSDAATLRTLGADIIGAEAIEAGRASGNTSLGPVIINRLGSDAAAVLVATFTAPRTAGQPEPPDTAASSPETPEAPPTIPDPADTGTMSPPLAPAARPTAPREASALVMQSSATAAAPPATDTKVSPVPPLQIDVPVPERRHPLRFVWQMDAEGRFTLGSDEFNEVIGPKVVVALGRPWKETAAEFDPAGQVARAVATRDTWSGITVSWPVDGSAERLQVELSGLPVYDRNRAFLGYRGFGVCRDLERIAALSAMRRSAAFAQAAPTPNDAASRTAPSPGAASEKMAEEPLKQAPEPAGRAQELAGEAEGDRPALTFVPPAKNVVPFRSAAPPDPKPSALSPVERNAFRELARQLTARLKGEGQDKPAEAPAPQTGVTDTADTSGAEATHSARMAAPSAFDASPSQALPQSATGAPGPEADEAAGRPLLDRLPVGILVYRFDQLLYANRAFFDWTGYADLDALADAGGLDSLFVESGRSGVGATDGPGKTLAIATNRGDRIPVEGRLFSVPWNGESALVLMLVSAPDDDRQKAAEMALRRAEAQSRELKSILDTATDGVIIVERGGRVLSGNRSAEALFGCDTNEITNTTFTDLFTPDSQAVALDYLDGLGRGGIGDVLNEGREVVGRVRRGGTVPLFMTIGRIGNDAERFCAVFRDITQWKKVESELLAAKQQAQKASSAKSDFLAKISHEIRTLLNSIIGFSEVMIEERFGPIGNERYREYLKDVRTSGGHVVSLLNDLLDLSKIEAGRFELTLVSLGLNEVVQSCIARMQPQANRERIIIRSSLAPNLRPVIADERAVRQIVLNLLSDAIKFAGAGGQVIVSTAHSSKGEAVLRVRDTGIGMNETDLQSALEPFRQFATSSRWGSAGNGLGLPLTKALAGANRATFNITSKVNDGTLVEIAFPAAHALVE